MKLNYCPTCLINLKSTVIMNSSKELSLINYLCCGECGNILTEGGDGSGKCFDLEGNETVYELL